MGSRARSSSLPLTTRAAGSARGRTSSSTLPAPRRRSGRWTPASRGSWTSGAASGASTSRPGPSTSRPRRGAAAFSCRSCRTWPSPTWSCASWTRSSRSRTARPPHSRTRTTSSTAGWRAGRPRPWRPRAPRRRLGRSPRRSPRSSARSWLGRTRSISCSAGIRSRSPARGRSWESRRKSRPGCPRRSWSGDPTSGRPSRSWWRRTPTSVWPRPASSRG